MSFIVARHRVDFVSWIARCSHDRGTPCCHDGVQNRHESIDDVQISAIDVRQVTGLLGGGQEESPDLFEWQDRPSTPSSLRQDQRSRFAANVPHIFREFSRGKH